MRAPRWTLSGQTLLLDGKPLIVVARVDYLAPVQQLARRIVALLNATELSSDAVARLQHMCMEGGVAERIRRSNTDDLPGSEIRTRMLATCDQNIANIEELAATLNHTVRMYVELDEEASIALDAGETAKHGTDLEGVT